MQTKLTADTITDEQILEVLELAQYNEWPQTVATAYTALHGVHVNAHRRRQRPRYSRTDPRYQAARARCAEILNARGGK